MSNAAEVFKATVSSALIGDASAPPARPTASRTRQGRRSRGLGRRPTAEGDALNAPMTRENFPAMAALADLVAALWAAIAAQWAYNYVVYGWPHITRSGLVLSFFVVLAFVVANLARRHYALMEYLDLSGHIQKTTGVWNLAFLTATFVGFLDRDDVDVSRGAFVAYYFLGLAAIWASRAFMVMTVRKSGRDGGLLASRVMVVGYAAEVEKLTRGLELRASGKQIVRTCIIHDGHAELARDLAFATRVARRQRLDEILIAAPLSRADVIEQCLGAFLQLPAAVHLHIEPGHGLERFAGARVDPMGRQSTLRLPGHSMSAADQLVKRACDIVFAVVALVLFSPIMLITAIAIKIDSPGPVFFFQTRHGFNRKPFRIFKFRSMTAMENGRVIVQATQKDFRVTRMGRFMRRFNIDELPQLLNVLRGEMSLVGPRPHAIAHDRLFAKEIAIYPRRHNVKPGITGWAQVNGFRGPTESIDKIADRVRYDLHYIDNWSLLMDLWILVLTLFSRTAYRNAF